MNDRKKGRVSILWRTLAVLLAAGAVVVLVAGFLPRPNPRTPSGLKRFSSTYVRMSDGTRLMARVSLPAGLAPGSRVPAVMECTRYGTKSQPSFLLKVLLNLGIAKLAQEGPIDRALTEAGFAYVAVDDRGSGASFGKRGMEFSPAEVADSGEVVDWIVSQPWSNGRVGAYGMSFSGNTAEFALATGRSALAAAAPFYPDFDPVLENARPGGILNDHLCKAWNEANQAMDRNSGHGIFFTGPAPADDDKGGHLLAAAMAGHDSIDMYGAIRSIKFADDALAPGYRAADLAPWSRRAGIEASGAPLFVRVGWLDAATVNGAIERFLSYSNPQLLVIGPWSHGGWHANDPFLEMRRPRSELDAAQARELISFFSSTLREGGGPAPSGKLIRYYTFGEGVWKESATWPVPGFTATRLYFAPEGALSNRRPEGPDGADRYDVDFSATTGESDRWRSNLGGGAVDYPDRAAEDRKLLCYTGPALDRDMEVTGLPVISLQLASSVEDGAVYAYLEDVAPDGTVTYITEGQLRLLHRAVSDKDPPHAVLGPYHSFERGDASRVEPGKPMEVSFAMQATSVLLRKGHRIRIAIAGHDAANFERIPAAGEATYTVERNAILASWIELPMKAR